MLVEFRYTVRRYRGQIIGWGLGLTLYSMLMVSMYSDIAQIDFAAFLEYYPQDMLAFFGDSMLGISTPQGFLDLYFFNYMTIKNIINGLTTVLRHEQCSTIWGDFMKK